MRTTLLVAVALAGACQTKSKLDDVPSPHATPSDAGIKITNPHGPPKPVVEPPPTEWTACDAALAKAPKMSAMRRVQHIVNACKVCGEWKPLLEWNIEAKNGGPRQEEIEQGMLACKAFCNPNAKQRFFNTLDQLRGKGTRGPWRFLGEMCAKETSAAPDNRYASAPYFALDRIARAAGARPESAKLLEAIDLPMPLISMSGYGYDLAKSPTTAPDVGPLTLTVTPDELRLATVPHGKLTKDGVVVTYVGEPYPGALIKTAKDFTAEVGKLPEGVRGGSISIFAPRAMPAVRLIAGLEVSGERSVRLAAGVDGLPGWAMAGSIPIALRAKPNAENLVLELADNPDAAIDELKKQKDKLLALVKKLPPDAPPALVISLAPTAKVEGLAKLLGAAGYFDIKAVALQAGKPDKPKP